MKYGRAIVGGLVAAGVIAGAAAWMRGKAVRPAASPDPAAGAGAGGVAVSPEQAAASGVGVRALPLTRFQPRARAYASVLDPGPLLQLRGQLRAARAQTEAASAQAAASEREYRRLELLNAQDRTVSDRAAEAARAAREADGARLQAARATLLAAGDAARSRWGHVLAGWALAERSPQLDALGSGRQVLLSVALEQRGATGSAPPSIRVGLPGAGGGEVAARLVSASPLADPVLQSPAWFYRAPRGGLRTGMRVDALLPAGPSLAGVIVPSSAVVWYANRPWAYVQGDATHFVRREMVVDTPAPGGWFVARGWRGGERVVVHGAALLFSQEFQPRAQPGLPSGGGDDD